MSTSKRKPPRSRAYHHGDLRRALLDATLELIREHGPLGVTLREAARRAGVSQAAPYRHFADKAALLEAVAEEGFVRHRELMLEELRAANVPPGYELGPQGIGYVLFAVRHPAHFRVMFGPPLAPGRKAPVESEAGQAAFRALIAAVRAGQGAGFVRAGDVEEIARFLWSLVHGFAMLVIDGQVPDVQPTVPGDEARLRAATLRVLELAGAGVICTP